MSKLRIEKGASKVRRAPLKATIDDTVSDDLEAMCAWSENDLSYLVNRLLTFALAQSEDFQQYKAERIAASQPARTEPKHGPDTASRMLPASDASAPQSGKGAGA